jgi:hypothetical protein
VWRLAPKPGPRLTRAPAVPASSKAMCTSPCASHCVRRAQGATSGNSRSVNMRRVQRGHWRSRTSAPAGGARRAMIPRGDPPPCRSRDDGPAASQTGRSDHAPGPVSRSPATSTEWWGRPCARRREAAGGSWEASEPRVSCITIVSIHAKPLLFNTYPPWMATELSSSKVVLLAKSSS